MQPQRGIVTEIFINLSHSLEPDICTTKKIYSAGLADIALEQYNFLSKQPATIKKKQSTACMQVSLCEIHMKSDIAVMCRAKKWKFVLSVGTLIYSHRCEGKREREKEK
jgi:hypothetical protein